MVLLDTRGGNPKLAKTAAGGFNYYNGERSTTPVKIAGLSLYPDIVLCAGSKAARCMPDCLRAQGRGQFDSVTEARQARAEWFYSDPVAFMAQLKGELESFRDSCARVEPWGAVGYVRLNVLSDIPWERYGVPQAFPELMFYDYTKQAARLCNTPDNYRLIFSYSGAPTFAKQNARALATGLPVAVVFRGGLPAKFLGRRVIDGDVSDIDNLHAFNQIVGLRAKGTARHNTTGFVVNNPDLLTVA